MIRLLSMALALVVLMSCSAGSESPSTLDVARLASGGSLANAAVEGAVVWDDTGARLCQSLMESFPAQCGDPSVAISNPDAIDADFDESGGVRWTPNFVTLSGQFDGTQFTIE